MWVGHTKAVDNTDNMLTADKYIEEFFFATQLDICWAHNQAIDLSIFIITTLHAMLVTE